MTPVSVERVGRMKIVIVGGRSSLALALRPVLSTFAEVVTVGRSGCDVALDLEHIPDGFAFPPGVDAVINTAAAIDRGGDDPGRICRVNVAAVASLSRLCVEAGVGQFVQISSIFARLPVHSPYFGPYALSKRQSEEWVAGFAAKGLRAAVVRPAQFYGSGPASRANQPFLAAAFERAREGEDIFIYGGNDALRNFVHLDDVVEVIARIVRRRLVGTYDVVAPKNVRLSEVAHAAIAAFGSASTVRFLPDKPDIADNPFTPDDTLATALGYVPRISIEEGMRMAVAHARGAP